MFIMATTHIAKCKKLRCGTWVNSMDTNYFYSSVTGGRYLPILRTYANLDWTVKNVVYLIFRKLCLVQYVGETKNNIRERFRGHRTSIFSGKSNQIVHQHFHRDCHGIDNCVIIPIEKIESLNASEQMLNKIRKEREAFWQRTLQTMYPFGLNIRLKG